MSSELAFNIDNVSKTYHLYETPQDRLKQMLVRGRRQYFNEFQALKPVSFTLPKGEVLGVVGRNGAGKSTLLQLICGTLAPTTGHIQIQGRIAALLELGAGFNPQFSGRENIYLSASIMGISKQEVEAKIEDIIDFSGVRDFIDQPVSTYSSGMYVRLAFSVATSVEPDILIIDEALSVGDGDFARRSFERIMAMKEQGATILFCSHSLYQVEVLCSQVIWLEKGGLVKMGAPSQIIPEYQAFLDLLANNPEATPSDVGRVVSTEPAQHSESGQYARIIRVTAKTPRQQGDKLDLVSCETDLSLEIHFKSTLIDEVPQAAIVIHNASGQLISSCSAWAAGVQPQIDEEGNAHIQVEFPKLPLLKGTYYVGVLLFCQRGIFLYDEADPVATLQVSQPNQERGVVMLPHTWQAQTQPNTERKTRAIDDTRQPSDRWQVRPAQASDFDQLKALFQETFKESLHEDHWNWKYKHADSPGYIVLEGDHAVAFSGGAPRAGLAKGEPVTFVQLGDVMVDRRQRGILTKTGPFYRSIYHFAADKIGLDRDYAFAFGFPNKRHLRVGERQNLYVATDRILDVKWAPKAQQDWILTPWQGDEAQKDCVNRLWQVMQPHLKGCLTGVKDSDWFIYRYLEKPQGNYQLFLVSQAANEAEILGLIALKDHPEGGIVELLDFIAEPKCASQILAAAQGFAAQQKRHALMAWMTAHVYAWFKDTEESLEVTDVFIPGNAHDDPEHLALSKGNWWLMGGDSDFR